MIAHWDEVEWQRREKGEMAADWQRLGDAAGTQRVGVNRVRIEPGRLSTPPHSHGASEEIVYVLGGSGLSWQDEAVYELGPGDCIVHLADHEEHTLRGGPEGLEVLIYGTRHPTELGWLPRSQAIRLGWPWVQGRTDDPWEVEAQADPLEFGEPSARPQNIVNVGDPPDGEGKVWKELADSAGSVQTGLSWLRLEPGRARRAASLSLGRRGGVRDPRGRRHARALALTPCRLARPGAAGRRRPHRTRGVAAGRDGDRARLPRR